MNQLWKLYYLLNKNNLIIFKITKDHIPVIKFEDNFNIQQCISKSKAAVVNVIVESIEVNNPEHEL